MLTYALKQKDIKKKWFIIDASNLVLGRLAAKIASLLRGKHKTNFSPHLDCGDNVIVINSKNVILTGNKSKQKKYYRHTGYPGGLKELYFKDVISGNKPEFAIRKAVERMMASNALSKKQLANLRVFKDDKHNLDAQKPEVIDFGKHNRKNIGQ